MRRGDVVRYVREAHAPVAYLTLDLTPGDYSKVNLMTGDVCVVLDAGKKYTFDWLQVLSSRGVAGWAPMKWFEVVR